MKEEVLLHQEGTFDFKKEAGCFEKKKQTAKSKAFFCLHKNLYMNVHSSVIHSSQKVETTEMSIS